MMDGGRPRNGRWMDGAYVVSTLDGLDDDGVSL